jgi:coenzyme F420-reducing hydrogenase delta subunit
VTLERIAIYLVLLALSFGAGFIKGCEHDQQQYKEAETKFIERTKIVKEIERVEVPVFKDRIQWLTETKYSLIEAAKNETPNPAVCDLSPDRVRRIGQAATGNP